MAEFSIQQKINSYLASHSEMKGKSEAVILSAMQKEGIVTQAEIDSAKKTSAFGFGFNKDYGIGISFEKVLEKEPVQVPFKSPEELEQIRLETEKQQIFEAKRNEVVNHIQQRAVSSQLRTTVQELAKQYKLEGEELNEYVEFFFGDTLPKDWQKFANKNEPLYESGLKIKMGNNEKSIEDFLVKDLDIDILSNKGINTYANFLFMEQEELDKVDFNNLDKVIKYFGMDKKDEDGQKLFLRLLSLGEGINNITPELLEEAKKKVNPEYFDINKAQFPNKKNNFNFNNPQAITFTDKFEDAATLFEYALGVNLRDSGETRVTENNRKQAWGKDYKEKEFALSAISNQYDNAIAMLSNYRDSQGILNVGYWREKLGDDFKGISNLIGFGPDDRKFHFNITDIIEHLEIARERNIARLEKYVHSDNTEFGTEFYNITGTPFSPTEIRHFEEVVNNKNNNNKEIEKLSKQCFGNKLDKYVEKTLSSVQGIDGAGDIGVLLFGTEIIGKGIMTYAAKPMQALLAKTGGKKALRVLTQSVASGLSGGVTLGTWTAFQGSVNAVTRKAQIQPDELKNIAKASAQSFGFGAFGGIMQVTTISPLIKFIDKPSKQASRAVQNLIANNSEFTAQDIIKLQLQTEQKVLLNPSKLAKSAGFLTEVGEFTGYEVVADIIRDIDNIPDKPEDISKYIGEKFKEQLSNLGSIKAMSNLIMMMKGGRIGMQTVMNGMPEYKGLENIKVRKIKVEGKEKFEVNNNGDIKTFDRAEDVIRVANFSMLLESLKTVKQELDNQQETQSRIEVKPEEVKAEVKQDAEVKPDVDVKQEKVEAQKTENAVKPKVDFSPGNTEHVTEYDLVYAIGTLEGNTAFKHEILEKRGIKVLATENKDSALRFAVYEKDGQIIFAVPGFKSPKEHGLLPAIKDARMGTEIYFKTHFADTPVYSKTFVKAATLGFASDKQLKQLDAEYLKWKEIAEKDGKKLVMCGHSMGGALTRFVADAHPEDVSTRFVSFNAVGTGEISNMRLIENYCIEGDGISNKGRTFSAQEGTVILKSNAENKHHLSAFLDIENSVSAEVMAESVTKPETEAKPQAPIDIKELKIEKSSAEDLKEIQKIDLEAFEGKYVIDSDFETYKADLTDQDITTYAIKGDDGKVVGYYQLEPIENGELYIYSIGVRSDLRKTKASYAALKQMQENITRFAEENNVENVILDVDANNKALVKLYQKFGFKIVSENRGVEDGNPYHDFRMKANVKEVIGQKRADSATGLTPEKEVSRELVKISEPLTPEECKAFLTNFGCSEKTLNELDFNNLQLRDTFRLMKETIENPEIFGGELVKEVMEVLKSEDFEFLRSGDLHDRKKFELYNAENIQRLRKIIGRETKPNFEISLLQFAAKENMSIEHVCEKYSKEIALLKEDKWYSTIVHDDFEFSMKLINFAKELREGDVITKGCLEDIFSYVMPESLELARELCYDKDFPKREIRNILCRIQNNPNIPLVELARELCRDKDFPKHMISDILLYTNAENIEFARELCRDKDFPRENIRYILGCTNAENIELARELYRDKDFPRGHIENILAYTKAENIEFARELCRDKDFPRENIKYFLEYTNAENIEFARELYRDKDFPRVSIPVILRYTNAENMELARELCRDKDFPKEYIYIILDYTNAENIELARELCRDKDFHKDWISNILKYTNAENIELARELYRDKDFPKDMISDILAYTKAENIELARELCRDKDFHKDWISNILKYTNAENIEFARELCRDKEFPKRPRYILDKKCQIADILEYTKAENIELARELCRDKDFPKEHIRYFLHYTNAENIELARELCRDKDFPIDMISDILQQTNAENIDFARELCSNKDLPRGIIKYILEYTNAENIDFARELCRDKDFPRDRISDILKYTNAENMDLARELCKDKDFPKDMISDILVYTKAENMEFARELCRDKDFPKYWLSAILKYTNAENIELARELYRDKDFPIDMISGILKYTNAENIELARELYKDTRINNGDIALILYSAMSQNKPLVDILLNDIRSDKPKRSYKENIQFINIAKKGWFNTIEDLKTYQDLKNKAFEQKDMLRPANGELSDKQIEDLFTDYKTEISAALEIAGKDAVVEAFRLRYDGFREFCQSFGRFKNDNSFGVQEDRVHITEKFNPSATPEYLDLSKNITELKKQYPAVAAQGDKAAIRDLQNRINTMISRQREIMAGAVKMDPQTKVRRLRALLALKGSSNFESFIDLVKDSTPENNRAWNNAVNRKIFDVMDIDFDPELSKKLNLGESAYLSEILSSNRDFKDGFRDILEMMQKNPDKSLDVILDQLPQNIETKQILETLGINYDRWTHVDKNSFAETKIVTKMEDARQNAISSLEKEFNDNAFLTLPAEFTDGIYKTLQENGYTLKDCNETIFDTNGFAVGSKIIKRFYKGEKPISFDDLKPIMKLIKSQMNADIWTTEHSNYNINQARSTMYSHIIKDRATQIHQVADMKEDKVATITIRQTDMNDLVHSLFLGNHGSCCTAVGTGCNQFSAPTYIKNKLISAIEVVDGDNFVGNTMCYFAEVDGKTALILDNIELKGEYQFQDKIRDALFDYAHRLCGELGVPDLPIYAGPYRHKLHMDHLERSEHRMQIKGTSGEDRIYLDFITSGRYVQGTEVDNVTLYKIPDVE